MERIPQRPVGEGWGVSLVVVVARGGGERCTVHLGDEVGKVHRLDEGEVAPFGGEEVQVLFLGVGCGATG